MGLLSQGQFVITGLQNRGWGKGSKSEKPLSMTLGFLFLKLWGFGLGKIQTSFSSGTLGSEKIRIVSARGLPSPDMGGMRRPRNLEGWPLTVGNLQTPFLLSVTP